MASPGRYLLALTLASLALVACAPDGNDPHDLSGNAPSPSASLPIATTTPSESSTSGAALYSAESTLYLFARSHDQLDPKDSESARRLLETLREPYRSEYAADIDEMASLDISPTGQSEIFKIIDKSPGVRSDQKVLRACWDVSEYALIDADGRKIEANEEKRILEIEVSLIQETPAQKWLIDSISKMDENTLCAR